VTVVARSLDHVAATDIDGNVVDIVEAVTVEDKITRLLGIDVSVSGSLSVLVSGTVIDGLAATLIDTILRETRAIEANNITIIAIRALLLDSTMSGTVIVTTAPGIRITADHGTDSSHDGITTVLRSSKRDCSNSKDNDSSTHFFLDVTIQQQKKKGRG